MLILVAAVFIFKFVLLQFSVSNTSNFNVDPDLASLLTYYYLFINYKLM